MKKETVVVINPGSLSTKVAFYNRTSMLGSVTIEHKQKEELDAFNRITDQLEYRYKYIIQEVASFLACGL